MAARGTKETAGTGPTGTAVSASPPSATVNEVHLVGRVSAAPERRELPSGDVLWSVRLVVDRPAEETRSRQRVDTLECALWLPRVQRSASGWRPGDLVEVTGALRRRFFRTAGGPASRVEVEVRRARLVRRATT